MSTTSPPRLCPPEIPTTPRTFFLPPPPPGFSAPVIPPPPPLPESWPTPPPPLTPLHYGVLQPSPLPPRSPFDLNSPSPSPYSPSPLDLSSPSPLDHSSSEMDVSTPSPSPLGHFPPPLDLSSQSPSPLDLSSSSSLHPSPLLSPSSPPLDLLSPSPLDTSSPSPSPSPLDTSSPSPSPLDLLSPSPLDTSSPSPSPSPLDTSSPSPSPSPSPLDTSSPSPSPWDFMSPSPLDTSPSPSTLDHSFARAASFDESISEPRLEDVEESHGPIKYTYVEKGTQKGKPRLADNYGYMYCKHFSRKGKTYWRCSVRNKTNTCTAVVIEESGLYRTGMKTHNHPGKPGADVRSTVVAKLKETAANDVFSSASRLVETAYEEFAPNQAGLPSLKNMAKMTNYHRQTRRPTEPTDLDFQLDSNHIPDDFLVGDIRVGSQRHVLFASPEQLEQLVKSKTWYLDGTFHVVKKPFAQLYSIHCFIQSDGGDMKQVPVAFALMSKRRQLDYERVFQSLVDKVGGLGTLRLQRVVADFEAAVWQAVRRVFPGRVELRGCAFHWAQAIFRKVQAFGLEVEFNRRTDVYGWVKRVMALPHIHHRHIPEEFKRLQESANSPCLTKLMSYVDKTWIKSNIWPVCSWSVFGMTVRTNNDCEGWHRRLNDRATKKNLQFYLLADLLHKESALLPRTKQLVSSGQMARQQTKKTRDFNTDLERIWREYAAKSRSPRQTLCTIARLLMT